MIPEENFDELYTQLKRLARIHLSRERKGHTLQPTALVHEALMRIKSSSEDPQTFFRIASSMMRRILIDHARSRKTRLLAVETPADLHPTVQALSCEQILTVDLALTELSAVDPRQAAILEMRFFGGLTMEEIATALDISSRTVKREWSCARAWLLTRL